MRTSAAGLCAAFAAMTAEGLWLHGLQVQRHDSMYMLLPLVMCLGGCWWAVSHWGWPMWVYLPAVLLGLAAGAQNFWVFVKERLDRSKKDKPRRTGFNSHL